MTGQAPVQDVKKGMTMSRAALDEVAVEARIAVWLTSTTSMK